MGTRGGDPWTRGRLCTAWHPVVEGLVPYPSGICITCKECPSEVCTMQDVQGFRRAKAPWMRLVVRRSLDSKPVGVVRKRGCWG